MTILLRDASFFDHESSFSPNQQQVNTKSGQVRSGKAGKQRPGRSCAPRSEKLTGPQRPSRSCASHSECARACAYASCRSAIRLPHPRPVTVTSRWCTRPMVVSTHPAGRVHLRKARHIGEARGHTPFVAAHERGDLLQPTCRRPLIQKQNNGHSLARRCTSGSRTRGFRVPGPREP